MVHNCLTRREVFGQETVLSSADVLASLLSIRSIMTESSVSQDTVGTIGKDRDRRVPFSGTYFGIYILSYLNYLGFHFSLQSLGNCRS